MSRSPLCVIFTFLLHALQSFAGPHVTQMLESEPVVSNGLEFIAATESEWVCFNPPYGEDPVQIQLFIRNVSDAPLLFQHNDTFRVIIKDPDGNVILGNSARDMSFRTKAILLAPGGRCCLSRKADLKWSTDGKTRTLVYRDGTGSWATYGPLGTGSFTLSFTCKQSREAPKDSPTANWIGDTETKEVAFKIVDP